MSASPTPAGPTGPVTLVAYASKMGSNREIATVVGETLTAAGHRVTVLPAREARDVTPYDVVVLGSAIYNGHWRREAVRFLRRNREALARKRVWLFHSGPVADDATANVPAPPDVARLAARIGARPPMTFGGRLEVATARGFLAKWMARGELGGDWRDWDEIREWCATVADESVRHA